MSWGDLYRAQVVETISPVGMVQHLRVWRHDGRGGIPWDDLQAIKNEMLGEDVMAIELYPPQSAVVDEANIRHLWVVPEGCIPFGLDCRR